MRAIAVAIVAVLGLCALRAAAAARPACSVGDLACFCTAAGGKYRDLKKPLEPTCTIGIKHQGVWRFFNVFLPSNYGAKGAKFPLWVHLHGVYWASMGDISSQMGFTVPASDATPVWDTLATDPKYREAAVIVYPQATSPGGDQFKRTFWSLPFWHCSVGNCIDPSVDDVGYIEKIFRLMPERFAINKSKVFLTGTSAGGMMLNNLLCSSSYVSNRLTAAVDIIGGIGAPMKDKCKVAAKSPVPLRIVHGEADPVLRFYEATDVDGAPFLSTKQESAMWKDLYGCSGESERATWSDATTSCSALCGRKKQQLELCGMRGVGHDLNNPHPGYPFSVAWDFLSSF